MSDSKDFNLSDRRKKVENFEVKIEDTYREQELMEDLMSYSQYEKKMASTHTKGEPRKVQKIRKSVENERFFKRVWIGMILSICLMLGQFVVFGTLDMLAIIREDAILKIKIPKGARKCEIVNILHENGVVNQPTFFKLYLFLTKGAQKFIPGTFEVKTNMDYEAIVNYLQSNANRLDSDIIDVTIPEGKNVMEIAEILENNEICSAEEFMNACKSSDYDKQYDFLSGRESTDVEYNLEGYLYPDTYSFYKNVEPKTIIKKFLNNFNNKISKKLLTDEANEKVSVKTLAEKKSMSVEDVLIFASLIQAEASNDADMLGIASVIENRLSTSKNGGISPFGDAINGCLSLDSTVWYPYRSKDKVPQNIQETYQSNYNTYKFKGLPKGAICNPGMTSIEAVLNHKPTQYYFYCHSKDGKTFYAKTFSEHSANLKKA
ncbi:MAG: endolytic transglycosylase MltG [Bacilli bacterium]